MNDDELDDDGDDDDETPRFSDRMEIVLNALVLGLTHAEAAMQVGRQAKYVQRLLARDDFRLELNRRRAAYVDSIAGQTRALAPLALGVIREAMDDTDAGMSVRLRAAQTVLNHATRLNALAELELRLVELETKVLTRSRTIEGLGAEQ